MFHATRPIIALLFTVAACSSGDADRTAPDATTAAPVPPVSTAATPTTTSAPGTTSVSSSVVASTNAPASTESTVPATAPGDDLATSMPAVDGYVYGDILTSRVWDTIGVTSTSRVSATTRQATRSVFSDGGDPVTGAGWVGELTVFSDARESSDAWRAMAAIHRLPCLAAPSTEGFAVVNEVPSSWEAFGSEIVMTGTAEPYGDFAAVWHHGGLIWAMSGWSNARNFATALIAQQDATATAFESEPERIDIVVLEGVLADAMPATVQGFLISEASPVDIPPMLDDFGNCMEHLSAHIVSTSTGAAAWVMIAGFAETSPCDRGAGVLDDIVAAGGQPYPTEGAPAALLPDGNAVMIASPTGVVAQVVLPDPAELDRFDPVIQAIADRAVTTVL